MKNHLILLVAVILVFIGIVSITGFLGNQFGKAVELVVLGIVAIALLILYIKQKRS